MRPVERNALTPLRLALDAAVAEGLLGENPAAAVVLRRRRGGRAWDVKGMNVLRLQRWMGHHSPAFTLETYGHLIDGDLALALDLGRELRPATTSRIG